MKVGFIGLGLMGIPMSKNILKKGLDLTVWNRSSDKADELVKLGAKLAKSPQELGATMDVIITMVTAGKDVEAVLFGENGVAKDAKKGLVVIDMSTIGPTKAREIGKQLEGLGIEFIDAPVTGSTPKAITGELTIFVGGEKEVFEKIKSVLETMGTNIQYMGESGSGQGIKLINNHLIAATVEALAEGMLLADAMGMDRKKVGETLKTVPAMSGFMNLKLPNFVTGEFPLLFSAANMKKDVTLALEEAKKSEFQFPILENSVRIYDETVADGLGDEDMSVIIKALQK